MSKGTRFSLPRKSDLYNMLMKVRGLSDCIFTINYNYIINKVHNNVAILFKSVDCNVRPGRDMMLTAVLFRNLSMVICTARD